MNDRLPLFLIFEREALAHEPTHSIPNSHFIRAGGRLSSYVSFRFAGCATFENFGCLTTISGGYRHEREGTYELSKINLGIRDFHIPQRRKTEPQWKFRPFGMTCAVSIRPDLIRASRRARSRRACSVAFPFCR